MNPEHLKTFIAVVETKKISAAAKTLNLSQPAVTTQIRQLETFLGVRLFQRSVKGMKLSDKGEKLLIYAREILQLCDKAVSNIAKKEALSGELNLVASSTIGNYILPPILHAFSLIYPKVAIKLQIGNTNDAIKQLLKNQASVGLIEGACSERSLFFKTFIEDEVILLASPLLSQSIKKMSHLKSMPFIFREQGSGTRFLMEKKLKELGISIPSRTIELGSSEAIKTAIMDSLGLSFLSKHIVQKECLSGQLIPINMKGLQFTRPFQWVLNQKTPSGLAKHFFNFANANYRQHSLLSQNYVI